MRTEQINIDVPLAAPAAGAALLVERFAYKTIIVGGTFTGTLRIQGSVDGTNFADLTADLTTPGATNIPHTIKKLRVNLTALSAGTPVVSFSGFDGRTE